jgi:hypothetical protein
MSRIDIIEIELEARRLRAEDLRRREPVFAPRLALCLHLAGENLLAAAGFFGRLLRPLFSWNPQAHRPAMKG